MMKRLQDKRIWFIGGALTALLIITSAWFAFIGPVLSSTGGLRTQRAATLQQNASLQATVTKLKQKSAHLSQYTASLQAASAELPSDSGLPAFTRQLSGQAKTNHVSVNSIVVGGITAVAAAPATTGTTGTTTTETPTDTTGDPAASGTPATTAPASTAGGLFSVQVTITSAGSLTHQLAFLEDIRSVGPRRALITSTRVAPGVAAKSVSIDGSAAFTTQLTLFSAPQSPADITALKKLLSGKIGN